jgi:hypothetical protein
MISSPQVPLWHSKVWISTPGSSWITASAGPSNGLGAVPTISINFIILDLPGRNKTRISLPYLFGDLVGDACKERTMGARTMGVGNNGFLPCHGRHSRAFPIWSAAWVRRVSHRRGCTYELCTKFGDLAFGPVPYLVSVLKVSLLSQENRYFNSLMSF